ncbi:hypothetical protein C9374_005706 [Naegleria lovaniensis]|uniref:Translation initiation factor 3 N-terminal domain-containing protein n=1 Tax=Naegleria lovaniensis TaxID=51637 RepID=A0AA88GJ42_NAELO|nr:uncharacterized protein C9374_005706 [Naegleria lovaniensis]KAG2381914.1 hypothetical protein C9374_005706 [Naegleria lovaniensis]
MLSRPFPALAHTIPLLKQTQTFKSSIHHGLLSIIAPPSSAIYRTIHRHINPAIIMIELSNNNLFSSSSDSNHSFKSYHSSLHMRSTQQEENEDEDVYLDRVAAELDIQWTSYFKARSLTRKPGDRLRRGKQLLTAAPEDLGIEKMVTPINYEIPDHFTHYRLIRISDGSMVGEKVPRAEAEAIASNESLDLILVVDTVDPPIVKLGDYVVYLKRGIIKDKLGELKELEKQLEEKKVKEIRFSGAIEEHDLDVKMKKTVKFLLSGKKVRILCFRVEKEEEAFQLLKDFMSKVRSKLADELPGMDVKKILEEEKPFKQKNEFLFNVKIKDDAFAKIKKLVASTKKEE